MEYTMDRDRGHLTVKVDGKLDAQTAPELERGMSKALDGVTEVEFDLSGLDYISSAGLRILFASYKLMDKRGGELRVTNATGNVMEVLDMSGFGTGVGSPSQIVPRARSPLCPRCKAPGSLPRGWPWGRLS